MTKITLTNLVNLQNETTAVNAINTDNAVLTTALDNTLSRDGTSPNTMLASLDMNSFQIYNLPSPATVNSPARLADVTTNPTITVPPVGTSGATVGLLNTNLTFSGNNIFSGTSTFNGSLTTTSGSITATSINVTGNLAVTGNLSGSGLTPSWGSGGTTNVGNVFNLNGSSASNGGFLLRFSKNGTVNWSLGHTSVFTNTSDSGLILYNHGVSTTAFAINYADSAIGFYSTTNSTSISTGALFVTGGVGIAKSLYVGGPVTLIPSVGAVPASSGTAQPGLIQRFSTNPGSGLNNVLDIGGMPSGSFAMWMQVYNQSNLSGVLPLSLQPLGGNVSIGYSAGNPAFPLTVNGTICATGTSAQIISNGPTGGIGYTTGAGGTVTQATSKSTGVTLNTMCGAITTNNAALAAGTIVSFNVNCSGVAATDVIVLNHISGGTVGSYTLNAQAGGSNNFVINIRNNTAGSLSEAIVIQFSIIKAVNA